MCIRDRYKEGDANTVAVAANVYERLDEIREQMPPNFDLIVIYDQATFINAAISEVRTAAIQGAFLAVFVLFLFLRDIRRTLIVAATIPASVMVTFALMDIYDITLNVMSLGGIALAVGMLMDNAIVVLENIARHRSEGRSVLESAEKGASEVGGAVMAATLTTIAVFLPLAFVEGIAGQLFKDQALTVTFALVASLILAFTLIPMLSALGGRSSRPELELSALGDQVQGGRFRTALQWLFVIPRFVFVTIPRFILVWLLRVTRFFIQAFTVLTRPLLTGFDKAYERLSLGYAGLLGLALRARLLTLMLAVIAFFGSAALIPTLPVALIPPLAQGEFKVDLELSPGTRLELTDATLADLDYTLSKGSDQLLDKTYSVAGTGGRMDASAVSGGENVGEFNVVLSPGAGAQHEAETMSRLRDVLSLIPDVQYTLDRPQLFSFSKPLEVIVSSSDLEDIREVADALALAMQGSTMFRDVESTMRAGYPEVQIEFDQDRAAALGLNVPDVASRVVSKVKGEVPTEFTFQDKKIDVRVRVEEDERDSASDIGHLVVSGSTGPQIRLDTVADIVMGVGPADIQRIGQQRVALVRANVVDDDLGIAATKVQRILEDIPVPAGLKVIISGQNEEMEASFRSLQFALILALIMVYLVMASLFESLLHPFIIMFTIPLAGVGAVIALAMTGTSVSVVVFIGLILLVGIVVNNAIVLIDRVNQLRQTGLSRIEAVQIGAGQRFRPILMTTMTTILGLLPMAIGLGEASELRTPMAITVIGGLLVSMLLTLIVIPVVYDLVDRKVILVDPDAPPEAAAQT